ncbi:MAG TPA: Hsp20/alpha crystallin family protein [Gaiellaceae bacterium]|jgi:HSP20 family protein
MAGKRDIDKLQGEIQELFADLWQVPRFSGMRRGFRPAADCFRTEEPAELHVIVELPGVDPESVQIVASGRTLLVAGERKRPQVTGSRYQQIEIEYGAFQRQIQLTDDVDSAHASATYERGLLRIVLPLANQEPKPVRVPIEIERPG